MKILQFYAVNPLQKLKKIAFDYFACISEELFGRDFLEKINPIKYTKLKLDYTKPIKQIRH